MEDCGVRNGEYLVHLVRMNKLSACRVLYRWKNGTRCRDVKILWCHSILVWMVFEDSIPTYMQLFSLFVTCFCCFICIVV